ncbi:tRNA pseudouridine synthase D [Thalassotalea insulae]|uniref:tRNA pseudouridine synthase D n=2 Tax=Thalassotalea insulae TaxID=2056778 RepID=A0ABQ6GYK7_9GAMM|nr:tRNA pseudouridine synthase D [Thalassotalea insulae]
MLADGAYLYGKPEITGDLRSELQDFVVKELLPFEPSGEGEHLLIKIRKADANTVMVARQLAKYFGVKDALVSYAGLKDRFAVTEQWFGIHLPGKQSYDLSSFTLPGVDILSYQRHHKKLRIGSLSGNHFTITLRNVSDVDALHRRWHGVTQHGVPNYFGEQRFGRDGGNIDRAKALFAGQKVKDKKKRSIYLSAARSLVFNQIISTRLEQQLFEQLQVGDVLMLAGSQSVFVLDKLSDDIKQRFVEKDLDITASMWGAGQLMTQEQPQALEQAVAEQYADICQGLAKFGLKQERRRIRLSITDAKIDIDAKQQMVTLHFSLPAGCFATSVLRELLDYRDLSLTRFD